MSPHKTGLATVAHAFRLAGPESSLDGVGRGPAANAAHSR